MTKTHILNGDSLKSFLPESVQGELIVARECLIDGDVRGETLDELFANRAKFIGSYGDFTPQDYFEKTVVEIKKITIIEPDSEIYCWFEHDLFCQVNFWFVIALLQTHSKNCAIYFVQPNVGNEYSFAHMNQAELTTAYQNALRISSNELTWLSQMWPLYQGLHAKNNCAPIFNIAKKLALRFPFLSAAIKAQQERSPDESGYGRPERRLLSLIKELNSTDFIKIFRSFSQSETIYSFGDMQIKRMLDSLIAKQA